MASTGTVISATSSPNEKSPSSIMSIDALSLDLVLKLKTVNESFLVNIHADRGSIRPPPPIYKDALRYPANNTTLQDRPTRHNSTKLVTLDGQLVAPFNTKLPCPSVHSNDQTVTVLEKIQDNPEHIYQTLPGETVYVYNPSPYYKNSSFRRNKKALYSYTHRDTPSGKRIILLEAIPETLAAQGSEMGVKTYSQLEVVEAGSETGSHMMNGCATHAVKDGGAPYIVKEITSFLSSTGPHGLPVLNESCVDVFEDDESCVNCANASTEGESDVSILSASSVLDNCVESNDLDKTENGFNCLDPLRLEDKCVFGSRDSVDKCIGALQFSRENSVHSENDSFEGNGDLFITDVLNEHINSIDTGDAGIAKNGTSDHVVGNEQLQDDLRSLTKALRNSVSSLESEVIPLLVHGHAQSSESAGNCENVSETDADDVITPTEYQAHADSGFSECSRIEFAEQVTENAFETEIYSEPEYSKSDVCVKIGDGSSEQGLVQYQKTLKRKYNGIDHTVYELSPSDSFHSSVGENMNRLRGPPSTASSDGICRLAHSSGSLTEQQRRRQPKRANKTLASGKCLTDETGTKVKIGSDAEPLMGCGPSADDYSESIQTAVILADVRRDYKRTAADRGTMYCAFGGITVVAAVVFVLIYFS